MSCADCVSTCPEATAAQMVKNTERLAAEGVETKFQSLVGRQTIAGPIARGAATTFRRVKAVNLERVQGEAGLARHVPLGRWPSRPPSAVAAKPDPASAQWSAISLFCGLGGLDLGFELQGIGATEAYDCSPIAVSTYNRNLNGAARVADLAAERCQPGRTDVLLAGAPCQGFSTVGKRDVEDPRNFLLSRVAMAAADVAPRIIILENVPAAAVGAHGRHWRLLEDALKWQGFNVRRVVVDGNLTGLAQHRRRLFMVCWRGSEHLRIELARCPVIGLRSAFSELEGLEGHDVVALTNPKDRAIAKQIGPGQKLSNVRIGLRNVASWDVPQVYGTTSDDERRLLTLIARMRRRSRVRDHGDGDPVARDALAKAFGRDPSPEIDRLVCADYLRIRDGLVDLRHTYNGKYRRLHWDMPSPTVDTHFGRPNNFLHPSEHRGLTLREAMRLQGIPDWFTVRGSKADTFRMVGNAVPPPMAGAIAAFVRDAILKS